MIHVLLVYVSLLLTFDPSILGGCTVCLCQSAIVVLLLQHGANMNLRSSNGGTPLYVAASHASADAVLVLLEAGADMTITDYDGRGLGMAL